MTPPLTVTGAGGFIGLAVCRRLAADGHAVVGIDLDPGARGRVEAAGAGFRAADVGDPAAVAEAIGPTAGVVHAAALVSDGLPVADGIRVNTRGTRNVIDAAGEAPVVVLASVAGWGYAFEGEMPEDAPPRPCGSTYVDTKGATETLALARGRTVIRPGDVYGPGSVPWVLRPLQALRSRQFVLPGRGDGLMTPIYIDDLVEAVVRALGAPQGRAYTVWDGRPVRARDFFAHHARWLGRRRVPTAPRPLVLAGAALAEATGRGEVSREALMYVSRRGTYPNARAREDLGWEPRVGLDEGMRRTENWLRGEGLI